MNCKKCGQCREKWEVKIDAYHDVSLMTANTIKELAASEMKRLNDKLDLTIDLIKRGAVK